MKINRYTNDNNRYTRYLMLSYTGKIVTQHKGIHNYTIGQEISYGGRKTAFYTVRKMSDKKTILVAAGRNHPTLLTNLFYTELPHWINQSPFNGNVVARASFRFQHGHKLEMCDLIERDGGGLLVKLDNPVTAYVLTNFQYFIELTNILDRR